MAAQAESGDRAGRRFAAAMSAASPFEPSAHLAVALSGGADSSALALLAQDWASLRGGQVTALTVDHGLRPGSDAEAEAVGAWCAARRIAHVVLRWQGSKPRHALQERARQARYALLESWCRSAGVLHLLLGHHAEDQVETIAMRRLKRSGPDGLDGMPAIAERTDMRLLRPLLGWHRDELRALLVARGATWIEDPSNRDPRFARARLRSATASTPQSAGTGRRRVAEQRRAQWLGRHAAVHPEGWVSLRRDALRGLPAEEATAMLRAALMTVSGREHPPRGQGLGEAVTWIREAAPGARRSVAGCLLAVLPDGLAVLRNPAACRSAEASGRETWFDGRFRVRRPTAADGGEGHLVPLFRLRPGGMVGKRAPAIIAGGLLPVPCGATGSAALRHVLAGRGSLALVSVDPLDVSFRPIRSLAGAAFAGPGTVEFSSTPVSPGPAPAQPRPPERVVPP
jgi:tRNA(Ile)-lysidine synthase